MKRIIITQAEYQNYNQLQTMIVDQISGEFDGVNLIYGRCTASDAATIAGIVNSQDLVISDGPILPAKVFL